MQIAVDVMGGDNAPACNIRGTCQAMTDFPDIRKFLLVGDSEIMKGELDLIQPSVDESRIELVHASQSITMSEPSSTALRQKKDSSITIAAELLKNKQADALVSAGHTGAAVAATVVKTRTLQGIERPGIAAVMPTPTCSMSGPTSTANRYTWHSMPSLAKPIRVISCKRQNHAWESSALAARSRKAMS